MCVFGTTFAVHPVRITVGIIFFFPDRQAHFYLIDNVTTGIECLIPMLRRNTYPHSTFSDFKHTSTMHTMSMQNSESLYSLSDYFLSLANGQRFIYFVFKSLNRITFVLISYPTFETNIGTSRGIEEFASQNIGVNWLIGKFDHIIPQKQVETTI